MALVLGRKEGEEVLIGKKIKVQVVEIRGGKVRLRFDCPKSMPVHRKEVADLIDAERKSWDKVFDLAGIDEAAERVALQCPQL
jgi:carbon storage regulator